MTTGNEQWWERLPRILGGWGFAVLIFLKFPFSDEPGIVAWVAYVSLIVFFVGIAHSTVTGIVLGNLTKAASTVRRLARGKRASSAGHQQVDSPGTTSGQSSLKPQGPPLREMREGEIPKKPRSRR